MSQGRSSSFIGWPRGLFAEGFKRSALKAANSGKSFAGRRELCIVGRDGVEKQLPLDLARKFSVFEREKITLAIGDRIRFTKNAKHRGQKFLNNELRTIVGIDEGKIIFDKGELVRNDAALHLDQGMAVTSHASQSKTVDQVIASVPVRAVQPGERGTIVCLDVAR
jgi:hypothetical protein